MRYRSRIEHYMYDIDIGHRFWRSPEAHARRMIGKPTDIFSFGLIVSDFPTKSEIFVLVAEPI